MIQVLRMEMVKALAKVHGYTAGKGHTFDYF